MVHHLFVGLRKRWPRIQTNHLSHFLMTGRLWPLMKATAEKYGDVTITQAGGGTLAHGGWESHGKILGI